MTRRTTNIIRSIQIVFASLLLAAAQDVPFAEGPPNFLLIGNSYTGSNCLDCVFEGVVKDGISQWNNTFYVRRASAPGRSYGRHWQEMDDLTTGVGRYLHNELRDTPSEWKWVVMQDQSQVPGFHQWDWEGTSFYDSLQAAINFNDLIEAAGAQTMFYMTWGRREGDNGNKEIFPDFLTMQAELIEGYNRYREATSTAQRPTYIAPCGLVFRTIYMDYVNAGEDPVGDDTLFRSLYTNDGSHPTVRGTYIVALTIYTSMTGKDPTDINFFPEGIEEPIGRVLQDAVSRTILETFRSGEIDYPWTEEFPESTISSATPAPITQAPTTAAPTTQAPTTATPTTQSPTTLPPTTEPPTAAPAPGPGNSGNAPGNNNSSNGLITIIFEYDDYPEEISWMFGKEDADEALFFQPFETAIEPRATISRTFDNLEAGTTYAFRVRDSEDDGICCSYGRGSITIYDEVQAKPLLHLDTELTQYFEVYIKINPTGRAQWVKRSDDYQPGTWEDLDALAIPDNESGWPGAFPTQPNFSLMINMDVDNYPEELSWVLYRQANNRQWAVINTWDGTTVTAGALDSTEFATLQKGWYRFIVTDKAHDGMCCDYGNGYVTLTGPLGSADGEMGLVWGNNGQFMREEEIFFRVSEEGFISEIEWGWSL